MVPHNPETLINFLLKLKEKNPKKIIPRAFDLKNAGIFLLLVIGYNNESNKLPWGQILPHQYLPLKKETVVNPTITGKTNRPSIGNHSPTTATVRVNIQAYFRHGEKILLVLM